MSTTESQKSKDLISIFRFENLLEKLDVDLRTTQFVVQDFTRENPFLNIGIPYRLDFFAIILVEKGYLYFRQDDKSYKVKEGDIVFVPISEIFWVEEISDDYQSKNIFFSVEFIKEAGFNYKSNDVLKSLSADPTTIIRNETNLYRKLNFNLAELKVLNNVEEDNYYFNEMIWHHFSLVIYEIDNYFKKLDRLGRIHVTHREDEITTTFFTLVRENFKEQHSVQYYADKMFVSRKYLTKVITKTMLNSPRDIIHKVLAVEARLLLKSSNLNIAEISSHLNFPDQASFSKFFRKHAGRSPINYKKDDLY